MLERFVKMSALFDFYGALLTEKQRRYLEMHFLEDLSLSEIADRLGVSRQAVYDIIHRSAQLLDEYESKLKLVERHQEEQSKLTFVLKELTEIADKVDEEQSGRVRQVSEEIIKLLGRSKEA